MGGRSKDLEAEVNAQENKLVNSEASSASHFALRFLIWRFVTQIDFASHTLKTPGIIIIIIITIIMWRVCYNNKICNCRPTSWRALLSNVDIVYFTHVGTFDIYDYCCEDHSNVIVFRLYIEYILKSSAHVANDTDD